MTEPTTSELIAIADAAIERATTALRSLRNAHETIVDGVVATRTAVEVSTESANDAEAIHRNVQDAYLLSHRIRGLAGALEQAYRLTSYTATLAERQAEQVKQYAFAKCPEAGWL